MIKININETNENQRLDKYLLKYFNKASKAFIYKIIRKKYIKLNDTKTTGNEILKKDDILSIYLSDETINKFKEEKSIEKTNINFKIIFEDKNIIVAYKPTNVLSQPDKENEKNSINDQLIFYMYQNGEYKKDADFTPSICNRLDRNTSGIILFGKNFKALQDLNEAFRDKNIDKYYLTAVNGIIDKKGTLNLYHKKDNNTAIISKEYSKKAKQIITEYEPICSKDNKTLLKVKLITGKSHQIRASFKYIGFPIIGDKKYNTEKDGCFKLRNQFLHCYKIVFKETKNSFKYLLNKEFLCKYMSKDFQDVLNFFEYKIEG